MTLTQSASANGDEMTLEETLALLEEQTRKYLGMSLDEFYESAAAGTLPDHPAVPHLVLMSGARATSC